MLALGFFIIVPSVTCNCNSAIISCEEGHQDTSWIPLNSKYVEQQPICEKKHGSV